MTLKDRILAFIDFKGIPVKKFEANAGLSNGAVSKMGDNTRRSTIDKISTAYPDLNEAWLLTGEGSMLKEKKEATARLAGGVFTADSRDDGVSMVKFIPVAATASFIETFTGQNVGEADEYPVTLSPAEEKDLDMLYVFEVEGDSMTPTLNSGALILTKMIPEKTWHYAEGVVVVAFADSIVVKRVARNCLLTDNYILLHSDNTIYGDLTVPLADIRGIFKARRIISSDIR